MNTLTLLRKEFAQTAELRNDWAQLEPLLADYIDAEPGSPERLTAGAAIADIYESAAQRLDASWSTRMFAHVTAADLRADAPRWRAGDMPTDDSPHQLPPPVRH